jgi:hypothetical protein
METLNMKHFARNLLGLFGAGVIGLAPWAASAQGA